MNFHWSALRSIILIVTVFLGHPHLRVVVCILYGGHLFSNSTCNTDFSLRGSCNCRQLYVGILRKTATIALAVFASYPVLGHLLRPLSRIDLMSLNLINMFNTVTCVLFYICEWRALNSLQSPLYYDHHSSVQSRFIYEALAPCRIT